jgi:hypothetical protein
MWRIADLRFGTHVSEELAASFFVNKALKVSDHTQSGITNAAIVFVSQKLRNLAVTKHAALGIFPHIPHRILQVEFCCSFVYLHVGTLHVGLQTGFSLDYPSVVEIHFQLRIAQGRTDFSFKIAAQRVRKLLTGLAVSA